MGAREALSRLSVHGANLMVMMGQEVGGVGSDIGELLGGLRGLSEIETAIVLAKYTGAECEEARIRIYVFERTGLGLAERSLVVQEFIAPNVCQRCNGTGAIENRKQASMEKCMMCFGDGRRQVADEVYAKLLDRTVRNWCRHVKPKYHDALRYLNYFESTALGKITNQLYEHAA